MISFNSVGFYLFVLLAWIFNGVLAEKLGRKYLLCIINFSFFFLLFYFRKKHFLVMLGFLAVNFVALKVLEKLKTRTYLGGALILSSVSFLLFFKYDFFTQLVSQFLPSLMLLRNPVVFLGVSFFSFRLCDSTIIHEMFAGRF